MHSVDDRARLPVVRAGFLLNDRRSLGDVFSVLDRAALRAAAALQVWLLPASAQIKAGMPPASRSARTRRLIFSRPSVGRPSLRRRPDTCSGLQPSSGFRSARLHRPGVILRGFDEGGRAALRGLLPEVGLAVAGDLPIRQSVCLQYVNLASFVLDRLAVSAGISKSAHSSGDCRRFLAHLQHLAAGTLNSHYIGVVQFIVAWGKEHYDVVIVGGAAMGSSAAYFLMENPDFDGTVLIVERDATFARSSTALSVSSVRHQFTNPLNVRISQFGTEFIREFSKKTAVDGDGIDLNFQENGYLFLWAESNEASAKAQVRVQKSLGADIALLSPRETNELFPHLRVNDIALASFGRSGEGWFDNVGLMDGLRRRACSRGATFIEDEIVSLEMLGGRVARVVAATGRSFACGSVVNASGPRCARIAAMLGIELPVVPQKRSVFVIDCQFPPDGRLPLMIDTTGVFCRPEGAFFICGSEPLFATDTEFDDFEVVHEEFEEIIWPALAKRSENFESVKVVNFWSGHYAFNVFDQNAIVGPHPEIENFYFVNGFSGHGIQQSPAMGRAISELVAYGEYRTLDLADMGYERILSGIRFLEGAII